ncbi:hypothetical protein [Fimbriimonas ginsengisoli]|uniref:Uncharacterized protein n=1 Tax=Fimbriimonas ginsengisoli Gsoil 348 TaxID=661478 RepID=A0A068NU30_FIMGI|nr:hypothetical protein [Fimbriimonas ginsengisoli]AIE85084.1 hypothetical protein OP10G_1716 [Fimbriimonas ginsengisoli Gsoil 348]
MRDRATGARERQQAHSGNHPVSTKMSPCDIREFIVLDQDSQNFMRLVATRTNLLPEPSSDIERRPHHRRARGRRVRP